MGQWVAGVHVGIFLLDPQAASADVNGSVQGLFYFC